MADIDPAGNRRVPEKKGPGPGGRLDLVPIVALLGMVLLGLAGWWLVPAFIAAVKHQDCVGSGSMSC